MRADDYPWALTEEEWNEYVRREARRAGTQEWMDERLEIFAPSMAKDEDARRWWRRWVRTSTSPAALMALRKMNKEIDVRHTLSAIRVPTLVTHPVGDNVAMIEEGRYMADRIPGSQMVEIEGEDHGWWVQRDLLARETERFLRGIWDRGEWDMVETDRVLATILFTDIVGSTEKLAELGDRHWPSPMASETSA